MHRKGTRQNKSGLIAVLFFFIAAGFYFVNEKYQIFGQQNSEALVPVLSVNDGDTVSVRINKKQEKVRLAGIDAPELAQAPWGEAAQKHLDALLHAAGRKVRIEYDVEKRDQYGRILAYLWTDDGRFVNLLMIQDGYAMLYTLPPNVKYENELRSAQTSAREGKRGIWSEEGLKEKPRDYRKAHPRE